MKILPLPFMQSPNTKINTYKHEDSVEGLPIELYVVQAPVSIRNSQRSLFERGYLRGLNIVKVVFFRIQKGHSLYVRDSKSTRRSALHIAGTMCWSVVGIIGARLRQVPTSFFFHGKATTRKATGFNIAF